MSNEQLPLPSSIFSQADEMLSSASSSAPETWKHWRCELCRDRDTDGPTLIVGDEAMWQIHLKSRKHRSRLRRRQKNRDWEEWKARRELKVATIDQLDTEDTMANCV